MTFVTIHNVFLRKNKEYFIENIQFMELTFILSLHDVPASFFRIPVPDHPAFSPAQSRSHL